MTYEGLQVTEQDRAEVRRVLAVHADACPVAPSLTGAVEITTGPT